METEVRQGSGDHTAGAMQRSLARLDTAVDVADPTTLEQKITNWNQMRTLLTAYISQHMQEGVDYYTLTMGGKASKPSLSKAGSEKILSLFNVHAKFRKDDETWEMLGRPAGVICYVCELYTKRGEFVGEGRGAREVLKEKDINKAIKMAQKCLGGTTPILIRSAYGITRTIINKLEGRDLTNVWIAGPQATWRKVVRFERQPLGPVRRLLFRDGFQVTASLDHRWPLIDGTLAETSDLRIGDCIQRSLLPTGDRHADDDYTWRAGLFVAEGHLAHERCLRFSLHAEEDLLGRRLQRIAERLGAHCAITSGGNKQTVTLFGPAPVGVVKQFVQGERSYGKHFTGYLFRQHLKGLASALGGYLDGDGSWTERHGRNPYWTVGFTRKNHELAHDLRALCAMLGYRCRIGLGTSAVRKVGKRFDTYTGWIKLEEPRYNGRDLGTIVDISEGEEVTYEIEVDGDHLFCLANGLVTHNSAQIDAILRTGALSDAFTQDLEDQAEPEARTMHQQKQRIVTLLKLLGAGVRDKASYEDAVQQYTGLALVPALYQDIIHRLEACVTERLRTKGQDGAGRTRVS